MAANKQQAWKQFKDAMKEKRIGKKKEDGKEVNKESKEEIVVQRLSSEVSGKAQKYLRVGPREFVHVGKVELTFENIQKACLKHFAPKIGRGLYCDLLAGEQGPSCSSLKQIPNLKLIYIRFTENDDHISRPGPDLADDGKSRQIEVTKRKCHTKPYSLPGPSPEKKKVKPAVPKSLSVSRMLMLGKLVKKSSTLINLYRFDIDKMIWNTVPEAVEFDISKDLLGEGGFRKAYKAQSNCQKFARVTWVVKEYKQDALQLIADTQQSIEEHSKKVIQMHCLAQNFSQQLKAKVEKNGLADSFGDTLQYGDIYRGKKGDDYVTVEEYVHGDFDKYINNDGITCSDCNNKVILEKAECLAHFSYDKSHHEILLVDIQGCGYRLFDPEIASSTLLDEKNELLFTTGNLSKEAIANFTSNHKCNTFCSLLELENF